MKLYALQMYTPMVRNTGKKVIKQQIEVYKLQLTRALTALCRDTSNTAKITNGDIA